MNWLELAACRGADPNLFFPPEFDEHTGASKEAKDAEEKRIAMAKAYCAICPVSRVCLEEAIARGEKVGVWGGVNLQAPRLLRERKRAATRRKSTRERSDAKARRMELEADVVQIAKWRARARELTNREGTA